MAQGGKPAGYVDITVVVRKEGEQWVSWCPEFDIASCGDSVEEATAALADTVELYLNTLEQEKQREVVFKDRGIEITALENVDKPAQPYVSQRRVRVPA